MARRTVRTDGKDATRKADYNGSCKGKVRGGVRRNSDVSKVQDEEDELLPVADSECRRGEFPGALAFDFEQETDFPTAPHKLLQLPMWSPMAFLLIGEDGVRDVWILFCQNI